MIAAPPEDLFDDEDVRPPSNVLSYEQFAQRAAERAAEEKQRERRRASAAAVRAEDARAEMDAMAERGDWADARGVHLVALYGWLHENVYGVVPSELDDRARRFAAAEAERLVADQFGGNYAAAVEFMRWTWRREHDTETWRRANKRDGRRIGWRLQFSNRLVDEYRVGVARTGAR